MGRRSRRFRCTDCERSFFTKFEHKDKEELINYLKDVSCEHCDNEHWVVTEKTIFSDLSRRRLHHFNCHDCRNRWYENVTDVNKKTLIEKLEKLYCPECESNNWKITDKVSDTYDY